MKKTYKILILIFFILFGTLFTHYYGVFEYSKIFTSRYDSAINLTITEDISDEYILDTLEGYSEKYNMDITRSIPFPGGNENRKSLTSYVYIDNFDWFNSVLSMEDGVKFKSNLNEGEFLSNIDTKDENQIGRFSIFNDDSREIYIRPLRDMKNRIVETTYSIHLNNEDYTLNEIIENINQEQESIHVEKSRTAEIYADMNLYYMYSIIVLIFFILILAGISFVYDVIVQSKSFGIKKLYGYSNFKMVYEIFKEDIFKPIIFSNIVSTLFIFILLYFKNSFAGFKQFMSMYLLVLVLIDLILILILIASILIFKGKDSIQLLLKGKRRNIIALNTLMKIVISFVTIVTLVISINIFNDYKTKSDNLKDWDKTKHLGMIRINYANIIGETNDTIEIYPYRLKLGDLWDDINDNGGIMASYEQIFGNDTIVEKEIPANLAYGMLINENYLEENIVLEENGNRIKEVNDNKDTLTYLVPSQFKDREELVKEELRRHHLGNYNLSYDIYEDALEVREGIREEPRKFNAVKEYDEFLEKRYSFLNQEIIYIKDNQKYFTYDIDQIDLYRDDIGEYYDEKDNTIRDSILIVMSNDNLKEARKSSAIMSGMMKFRFEDYKYPEDGIVPLMEKYGILDSLVQISTVYDYFVDDINNMRIFLLLAIGISIVCILLIVGLFFYESSNYLYRNRKKISVMKLYGFNFLKRYRNYFLMISVIDLIIIALSIAKAPSFISSLDDIVNISVNSYSLIIGIGVIFYLTELILTYLILRKKENKSIINYLKGEI